MKNEYIKAIEKLDELEDIEILYAISNHFKSKADCLKECEKLIEKIKINSSEN